MWSKFFALAGHFSKLFELAGRSRLEIVQVKIFFLFFFGHSKLNKDEKKALFVKKIKILKVHFYNRYNPYITTLLDRLYPINSPCLLWKVAAAHDRQDLNCVKLFSGPQKITSRATYSPRAAVWTTLLYIGLKDVCLFY